DVIFLVERAFGVFAGVVVNAEAPSRLVGRQNGRDHVGADLHIQSFLGKRAALNDGLACIELDGRGTDGAVIPSDEMTSAGRELPGSASHPDAPINRSPERAIDQAHFAFHSRANG